MSSFKKEIPDVIVLRVLFVISVLCEWLPERFGEETKNVKSR